MDKRHIYHWHCGICSLAYIPVFETSSLQVLQGRHHNINKVWQIARQEKGIQWPWVEHSPWPQAWQQWASESESTSCKSHRCAEIMLWWRVACHYIESNQYCIWLDISPYIELNLMHGQSSTDVGRWRY